MHICFRVSNLELHVISCYYIVYCTFSLGQACSHIAALLFFIESHADDEKLPSEVSKTSKPMMWNQPPKKEISQARAQDMIFVKPTHSDIKPDDTIQCIKRSEFDSRHPVHRMLQQDSLTKLLNCFDF